MTLSVQSKIAYHEIVFSRPTPTCNNKPSPTLCSQYLHKIIILNSTMAVGNRFNSFCEGESSRKAKRKEREPRHDEGNGSKRRAGRPPNNETKEEKKEKKIAADQRYRSKKTAEAKRFEKSSERFLSWAEKLIEFSNFPNINPEDKKAELERLEKEVELQIQNEEKIQIHKNEQLKSLQIEKELVYSSMKKYQITDPECIEKLKDEKSKLQCEIRNAVKDKIGILQNQDNDLMDSIVKHHLTNANHDLKELGELLLKHNHNVDKCNRLQDENAELEAEIKELKLEIKWLRDFSDKLKAEGKTHQDYKVEFERKLQREKWRLDNVKDDLDKEIKRLDIQKKLLELLNKMTGFGIQGHKFDPIPTMDESSEMVQKLEEEMKAKEATIEGQQNELNAAKATIEALQNEKKNNEARIQRFRKMRAPSTRLKISWKEKRAGMKRLEKRVEKERAKTERLKAELEELMIVVERKVAEAEVEMVRRDNALDELMILTEMESLLTMEEVLLSQTQQPGDEEEGQMMLGIPEPDVNQLVGEEFGIQASEVPSVEQFPRESSPTSSWDEFINSVLRTPSPPPGLDDAKGPTTDEGQKLDAAFPKDI